jgi:hypothetical protein
MVNNNLKQDGNHTCKVTFQSSHSVIRRNVIQSALIESRKRSKLGLPEMKLVQYNVAD